MNAQTQTEVKDNDNKTLRELRAENRRLKQLLDSTKSELESCRKESERLSKYIELLELVVHDLLSTHYQGRLKAGFNNLELCTDDRCVAFTRYEDLLAGLRAAILLLK
jgi:predicted nuclease with TOPRIM domain